MGGFRDRVTPRAPVCLLLLAVLLAAWVPPGGSQVPDGALYCPPGDQGDQSPPGVDPARPHLNLTVADVAMRVGDEPAVARGAYLVAPESGQATVSVQVRNVGTASEGEGGSSKLRLVLAPAGGKSVTRTLGFTVPAPGTATLVTTSYALEAARYTLTAEVNPDRAPAETCTDGAPNPRCGGASCTTSYYADNTRTVGLLAGALPVLTVEHITSTGPVRASHGPHPDSAAKVTVTIGNDGDAAAFNLDRVQPGAAPFSVRIDVLGCDCDPQVRPLGQVAPGATGRVSATLPLHGLVGEYEVRVVVDPDAQTADLARTQAAGAATFALPTPNLAVNVSSELPREDGRLLVPEGEDLAFDVIVDNPTDAPAKNTTGGAFLVTVHRDSNSNLVLAETLTLPAGGVRVLRVTDPARNVTASHTYRVRVDAADAVLESSKADNLVDVHVALAVYEARLRLEDAARRTATPPGVDARVPFTLENRGTVTDTYALESPAADADAQRFEAAGGEPVETVRLPRGAWFAGRLGRAIAPTAAEGDEHETTIRVRSSATDAAVTANVTFVVGPDDLAPRIELVRPGNGHMRDDRIVLRVADNVELREVRTNLAGGFRAVAPATPGGDTITLDARGTPSEFELSVTATDGNGNRADEDFQIVRDSTAPRIAGTSFNPPRGVTPGSKVNLVVDARDTNMDRVEVQITQARPGAPYMENLTLRGAAQRFVLDWTAPERPGHYAFNITAYDKAGNMARKVERLPVDGLNIRVVQAPTVVPPQPSAGERVTFTYLLENTSPAFETGPFFVSFVLDFDRQIGLQRLNLQPGQRQTVSFGWVAEAGEHEFTLVVDQAEEVAEDNEEESDNLHFSSTRNLFPDQPLFAPENVPISGLQTFGARVVSHWWIPVLFIATLALFATAFVLSRRARDA